MEVLKSDPRKTLDENLPELLSCVYFQKLNPPQNYLPMKTRYLYIVVLTTCCVLWWQYNTT